MNKNKQAFPAIANQTYLQYRNDPALFKITKKLIKKLKKLKNRIERARSAHEEVEKHLRVLFEDPIVSRYVACKQGCSFCCHTQVSITQDEALLYAKKIMDNEIVVDLKRLAYQSQASNDAGKWYRIPYEERKCIFLGEENQCRIYKDRPMVCRSNNVLSDPENCKTEDGKEKPIRLLKTIKADMAIIAAFSLSSVNGALPYMLWRMLEKISKKEKDKSLPTS